MTTKLLEIVAGPNGSGKTTVATALFRSRKDWRYINADLIARGLDLSNRQGAEIEAGRVMLSQVCESLKSGESFGLETTLSGRIWQKYIQEARRYGYRVRLVFVAVKSPSICQQRILNRVKSGGHFVPNDVVSRRYFRGIQLFKGLYRQLVDEWYVFDNSDSDARLIAFNNDGNLQLMHQIGFKEIFGEL